MEVAVKCLKESKYGRISGLNYKLQNLLILCCHFVLTCGECERCPEGFSLNGASETATPDFLTLCISRILLLFYCCLHSRSGLSTRSDREN